MRQRREWFTLGAIYAVSCVAFVLALGWPGVVTGAVGVVGFAIGYVLAREW